MSLHPLYVLAPAAALATLLGGWLVVRFFRGKSSLMRHMSGLAAGYLVAVTLMRLLPEAMEHGGHRMAMWALGGFFLVHLLEHGLSTHFHYGEETHAHETTWLTGVMALVGLSLHSFMDGMALMAAVCTDGTLGLLVFLGILLHRIPEGATISSIFLVQGFGARGAVLAAGGLALAAWLGAFSQGWLSLPVGPVLALSAGLSLYVASADLLPQAQKEKGWKSTLGLAAGILLFLLTSYLVDHGHGHAHHH
ncbi:MAG: ZIP family metal transporter [Firmicutes bacterium]|nr:ZIP family metal transporter [Bacillota bacterium]